MAKAILELEMPENCFDCDLHAEYYEWAGDTGEKWCPICDCKNIPKKGRLPDCPLKPVERCEWILIDDDKGLWQCSKCGAEWVLEAGTPADNEMNYCPACGRRLEVEP